ncbi:FAD:protein FMN transferase [Sulfurihydrogenibium subterraneum]|uniref:FAD:protein FMN transferase n=1 Tax=Sulfurihydrogenibium subterraneum TaxID=171121 RepID=UPI00048E801B|nr:FAD:protein FMN transferase [Sulfurihydrogenibium subterraneum]
MKKLLIFIFLLFNTTFSKSEEKVFNLMGTYAIIDLEDEQKIYETYRYLKHIEELLSDYKEDSEITLINKMAGIKPVKVSPITFEIIKKSLEICKLTKGAFDITVGSITINHRRLKLIDENKAKKLVNCNDVVLDNKEETVFLKKKYMVIDLGGIGKGFAIQKAYEKIGADKGFIAIAGDLKVWGQRRKIGIYNPVNKSIIAVGTNNKDLCLSTSGNYFQNHIIGEKTDILQVSVVYDECSFTDAIDTGIFAMGEKDRKVFLKNAEFGYLIIYQDGRVEFNKKLLEYFEDLTFQPF